MKILLAEDEAVAAMLLKANLEAEGFQVCGPASRGEDALRIANHEQPDVVLMDIRLAGQIDGIEAARRIRAQTGIPVVFMTGYSDQRMHERAEAVGPAAYLVKPVTPEDLKPLLDRLPKDPGEDQAGLAAP